MHLDSRVSCLPFLFSLWKYEELLFCNKMVGELLMLLKSMLWLIISVQSLKYASLHSPLPSHFSLEVDTAFALQVVVIIGSKTELLLILFWAYFLWQVSGF